jgi:uncharacterized membrane-anchored protein
MDLSTSSPMSGCCPARTSSCGSFTKLIRTGCSHKYSAFLSRRATFDRGAAGSTACLAGAALWYARLGTVSVNSIRSRNAETFYWATILFSQTLGTALGDFLATSAGPGYGSGALVFAAGLAIVAALYFFTAVSRTALFWAAFIVTRPLGATVGDFLDKPLGDGGLALGRFYASGVILVFIIACILIIPQRAGRHPGEDEATLKTA